MRDAVSLSREAGLWRAIGALVGADGTAAHGHPASLDRPNAPARDLADALHLLCLLHGSHPGIVDHARLHGPAAATAWFAEATDALAGERGHLAQLVAAAGPLPSTPGQARSEAAVTAQRHALAMLAQSDRQGCALGAAVAVVLDWRALRVLLDRAAARFGLAPLPPLALPPEAETATLVDAVAVAAPIERAMTFGAQQLLAQHRALWDLLAARAAARAG